MHNALSLNGAITNESQNAELVVVNMPLPPSSYDQGIFFTYFAHAFSAKTPFLYEFQIYNMVKIFKAREISYMEFIEALTDGIERVLLVHGGGQEVVTAFS